MAFLRIVLAGVLAGVVMLLFSMMLNFVTSPLYQETPEIWKSSGALWFIGMVLLNMLMGLIYSLFYATLGVALGKSFKGRTLDKGLLYGTLLWFVGPLPNTLLANLTINLPPEVVVAWMFGYLLNALIGGVTIVFVFEELKR